MAPVTPTIRANDDKEEPVNSKAMWRKIALTYIYRFVPVSRWAPTLTPRIVLGDCVSGFIVGVMIVPTCLSWSSLAGLPLSCGLVAALVASFTYGTFGQCASLSMGPVAEITTLLISIPGIPYADRENVFQSLGVQVGFLSMVLSFVDCGTVIKTIFAKAVGDGYTCAAALLAIAAQLKVMFNVMPVDKGYGNFINTLIAMVEQGQASCFYCFLLFMVYCTYLIQIKKTRLPLWIPHQLIVVVVSILVTWGFRLDERWGMAIVRDIPASLSLPHFPPMNNLISLGPYTLTITVISFVQMYVVAQRVMPDIDPNTELFAGGVTNLLVNLMSGMPVSNSFSCSSVLIEQKVHTPLTAYSAGTVVLITILFLTRLGVFYYLPKQALAAIVVASVWRLVNFSGPAQVWRYSRKDASVWVLTFVLTVVGGITIGVLSGIAFSLILVVLRIARPRAVSVGFNMQTFRYGDIRKDPELLVYPNILMWRFDAPLYFINTNYFQERLQQAIAAEVRPIDVVLVTCGKVVDIDAAALATLPIVLDGVSKLDPTRPRRIILTDIHGRLEKVLLDSAALPIYVPEEYDRLSIEQITASGKFPVVFKKLEQAIAFAQRCISEKYGNVDTAPYPNVSFLTDVVVEAARLPTKDGTVPSFLTLLEAENNQNGGNRKSVSPTLPWPSSSSAKQPQQQQQQQQQQEQQQVREGDGAAGTDGDAGPHIVITAPGESPPALAAPRLSRSASRATGVKEASEAAVAAAGEGTAGVPGAGGNDDTVALLNASQQQPKEEQDSLVRHLATLKKLSTYSPNRELVGVLGVIRHSEVTPKQKKKLLFNDPVLVRLAFQGHDARRTKRTAAELSEFFAVIQQMLAEAATMVTKAATSGRDGSPSSSSPEDGSLDGSLNFLHMRFNSPLAESWARVLAIVRSQPEGLKIQVKPRYLAGSAAGSFAGSGANEDGGNRSPKVYNAGGAPSRRVNLTPRPPYSYGSASGPEDDEPEEPTAGLLVVKWGGVLTKLGISQAHVMGERLFARFYAAGDLPLRRLVQFTRHPLVTASDENRVVNTAFVVANALTQNSGGAVHRADITLNDKLTKTLGPVAKRLLREEYKYFESLLHIESAAAARHFFHIPGFRQLLWIPPLDRPLGTSYGDDDNSDDEDRGAEPGQALSESTSNDSEDGCRDRSRAHRRHGQGTSGNAADEERKRAMTDPLNPRSFGFRGPQDASFMHPSHAFNMSDQSQQRPNYNVLRQDEFYTPYQVLQELEEHMTALSTIRFPPPMAKIPLCNHETLHDVQRRYDAMLNNFLGAKRRIKASSPGGDGVGQRGTGSGGVGVGGDNSRGNRTSPGTAASPASATAASAGSRTAPPLAKMGTMSPDELEEDQMMLDGMEDSGGSSQDEGLDNQLLDDGEAPVDISDYTPLTTTHPNTGTTFLRTLDRAAVPAEASFNTRCPSPFGRCHTSAPAAAAAPRVSHNMAETATGPIWAPPGFVSSHSAASQRPLSKRYDVSDVSKLRDYGSYDIAYNMPLLSQLHAATPDAETALKIRKFARALQRFADITECLSRIGENVLEGVNSSKRFIIGSLVSNGLLRRLHSDFRELAMLDEERGVLELLLRAQARYMAENGGVEQDVRHMIRLFQNLPCRPKRSEDQVGSSPFNAWGGETSREREFRLRFPFISLPKTDSKTQSASGNFNGCTRLYFTSYLHVEGVLQCLFESATVEGFSRPSKEEMEATHQLYMRHLIFKIFRRRNVSFTETEVLDAFRSLNLLFRSDVEYETQQRNLRHGLAAIYHSMYYVSMEVYLSLGDADETPSGEVDDFPFFTMNSKQDGGASWQNCDPRNLNESGLGADSGAAGAGASDDGSNAPSSNETAAGKDELQMTARGPAAAPTAASPASTKVAGASASTNNTNLKVPPQKTVASSTETRGEGNRAEYVYLTRSPLYVPPPDAPSTAVGTPNTEAPPSSPGPQLSGSPHLRSGAASGAGSTAGGAVVDADSDDNSNGDAEANRAVLVRTTSNNVDISTTTSRSKARPAKKRSRSGGATANVKLPVKEATVLVTPEAGRRTAVVQEMRHRVVNVTPMRRVHEGLSLNDFVLLMKEVESAVRSQTSSAAR